MALPRRPLHRLGFIIGAIAVFGFSYYAGQRYSRPILPNVSAVLLNPPIPAPDFSLTDQNDNIATVTVLKRRWTLLFFCDMYSKETDSLINLAVRIHNRLADEPGLQAGTQTVLVDLSGREQLPRKFMEDFDETYSPRLVMLRGAPKAVAALAKIFGLNPGEPEIPDPAEGGVTAGPFLLNPDGLALALFTRHQDAATIARDLSNFASFHNQ